MRKLTVIMLILAVVAMSAVSCAKKQETAPAATTTTATTATTTAAATTQAAAPAATTDTTTTAAPAATTDTTTTAAPAATTDTAASTAQAAATTETAATTESAAAAAEEEEVPTYTPAAGTRVPTTLAEKFSYVMGVYCCVTFGDDYAETYFEYYKQYIYYEMDSELGKMGIEDTIRDEFLYTMDDMNAILAEYATQWSEKLSVENLERAESFLAENAKKEAVKTTESGLQYIVLQQGTGAKASRTDSVELDYELTLLNGEILDSSYERGEHSTFPLDGVIEGFAEGVMLMPMGSHYIFYIHPDLGYGTYDLDGSGGNQLLIFEVETYAIVTE
ncbi:MAG: FKBP-type peptidyl-prolyl cis-trans isomerase [Spirochaetales bacterium]|nr:FKBP-type peptidyl-prolyl cis-trans isomerase [Spirochaetales bacterium]